jgi:hypothetical protein
MNIGNVNTGYNVSYHASYAANRVQKPQPKTVEEEAEKQTTTGIKTEDKTENKQDNTAEQWGQVSYRTANGKVEEGWARDKDGNIVSWRVTYGKCSSSSFRERMNERMQEIRAKRVKKKLQELERRLARAKRKARKNKIDFRA